MTKKIEINEEELKIKEAMDSKVEEITELQTTKAEIEALYKAKLETLKAQYEEKVQGITANIDYKMQELKSMFGRVSHKSTKTQEKVSLLGGDVVLKKASIKLDYDKEALLAAAKKEQALYIDLTEQVELLEKEIAVALENGLSTEELVEKKIALQDQLEGGDFTLAHYIQSKTVESFAWSDYKDTLSITESGEIINNTTGEVVTSDLLRAVEVPEEFLIK